MSIFVVIVHRDRWSWPRLTLTVEGRFKTREAADLYITNRLRATFDKRRGRHWSRWNSMRIHDFRVVDAVGLKRLQAAAKASVTIRRKRAAQKAVQTKIRRGILPNPTLKQRMLTESKSDYYPGH